MSGLPFLLKATGAKRSIIAVEANKQDAAESLRRAILPGAPVSVEVLPVKYPQGAEKMLITALLGREVPSRRAARRCRCRLRQRRDGGGTRQTAATWHGLCRNG